MILRSVSIFLALLVISSAALSYVPEDWDNGLPEGTQELKPLAMEPESVEEMAAAASLIVRGTVNIVEPLEPEFVQREGSQRNYSTRRRMLAIITVEEVYKGGFNSSTLSVEFLSSSVNESPMLMSLREGERTILFLVPGPNPPHFAPVNMYSGKAPAGSSLSEIKDEIKTTITDRDALPEDTGEVTVNIRASESYSGSGQPAYISVVVYNNTRGAVRLDSSLNPVRIFTVVGPGGERISPMADYSGAEANVVLLAPDHFTGARYNLAKYFSMSDQGIYKVRASILKPTWKAGDSPELIVSNTVSIVVGSE